MAFETEKSNAGRNPARNPAHAGQTEPLTAAGPSPRGERTVPDRAEDSA